ncbi:GDSL esterase/lipase [Camellia lanceoleosa]|uniref:GDSL esterase/lipase n=1 Tax=Camellia lanceoleosa TaxID=1840588 RepID=A0ACC0G0Q0_9ERIC|nr:GDSL esterase/lipase [Camellia lanceoleosa]
MAGILALLTMFSLASLLTEASVLVPALYVFGDSIVDGGNTQANPLYGIDLNTTIPIRWSNGKTVADFIASFLGLPFVPPSTSTSGVKISKTGVNYGHSSCGLLRQTFLANCSFEDQIGQFNLTVANDLTKEFNPQELVQHLTSSVFLVSFGQNDYNFNYLSSGVVSKMAPQEFAKILLNEMSTGLKTLYKLGARKFVVKNIWPLGCLPHFVNQLDPRAVSCNETINQLVVPYSNNLPIMLNDLQSYLIGAAFSHSNEFQFVADLMENPRKYGITNTIGYCYDPDKPNTICKDRDQYLNFDFFHPTQAANYVFSLNCFDGTLCSPLNIRTLVGA